ncbi:MAG TPA: DEAD/DEAH box helicase, partial [Bacteroidales bacterium]|nr:DEAD/DEAH box helicase [Bacteroidales bacterium]
MSLEQIKKLYKDSPGTTALVDLLKQKKTPVTIKGLSGSASVFLASGTADEIASTHIFVLSDKEEAAYFYDDLEKLTEKEQIYFFPSSYKRSAKYDSTDESGLVMRTKTLDALEAEKRMLVVTYPEALIEKVITRSRLKKNTLEINNGESLSIDFINDVLSEYGFEQVDFVYEPGQYSIRGSIVDLFSFSASRPHRIDFFGDEIDSIRTFDTETQLSDEKLEKISVVPNLLELTMEEARISFLDFIPEDSVLWIKDTELVIDKMRHIYEATLGHEVQSENGHFEGDKTELLTQPADFAARLKDFRCIETGNTSYFKPAQTVTFNTSPQPVFNKNFELLAARLEEITENGYTVYILSENTKQFDRLRDIFEGIGKKINFTPLNSIVNEGFADHNLKLCLYTDHQIFERYHKYRLDTRFTRKESITIKELTGLHPGDYIVHIDHGIGKFGGLEKIEVNGKMQEAIRLVYRDNDILYVNIHSLHRISKYKGKEGTEPRIYKLGTGAWQKLKQNTKKKVKDIAKELIALYAKRRAQKGFSFSSDTYLQNELEASFIYEDTPDQESATRAVKEGMESDYPMDRLVCGDVGFGKTEVAIRAAFKAVTDNKQVAVLVPTTVLALQHYQTFKERLKDFPCTIDYISRLKNGSEQKQTISNVKEGKADIVIGTHRLVGKDIKFKDLGLLIIDEEQKFGVTVKEKLKKLKVNVDTLTLTATPIPRTLQFSLMGARDLSIINTPPPNRHPIITELHP